MRSIILTTVAGAALALLAGCRAVHEPSQYELGEKALARGDKVAAKGYFEEALRLEPVHKHAWRQIAYLKAEQQGCKEHTKETRDAFLTFLMLETYQIGNVEGDVEAGIPEGPREPHLARNMAKSWSRVLNLLTAIEGDADICYEEFASTPGDTELKALAVESQEAVLAANLGVSPRAHYYLGEIARISGDEAAARGHFEQAKAQAASLGRTDARATIGLALTGGDLDAAWNEVRAVNDRELYLSYAEAAVKKGEPGRAAAILEDARRRYADIRIWRMLAEVHLLQNQVASARDVIATLERWPRQDRQVETFLAMCAAALDDGKVDGYVKALAEQDAVSTEFSPARLAAHVDGSGASAGAKGAVRAAAGKLPVSK